MHHIKRDIHLIKLHIVKENVLLISEHNKAPTARAGSSKTVWLPATSMTLDGSNSTDDTQISSYSWTQIRWGY